MWHAVFGGLILCLAAFGAATNVAALILLTLRQVRSRRRSNGYSSNSFGVFHGLLRLLCFFDLLVVACGALSYGFPNVLDSYTAEVLPKISPFLIPAVHVALMASVYCTVLISLERYVRICYLCQLRDTALVVTESHMRYYKLAIVVFPILFYLPKFFEVRWDETVLTYDAAQDCHDVLAGTVGNGSSVQSLIDMLSSLDDGRNVSQVVEVSAEDFAHAQTDMLRSCVAQMTSEDSTGNATVILRHSRRFLELKPTSLRKSPVYYFYYCVMASCLVSMILPLTALLFLNISTARVLNKMSREDDDSNDDVRSHNGININNVNKRKSFEINLKLRRLTTATLVSNANPSPTSFSNGENNDENFVLKAGPNRSSNSAEKNVEVIASPCDESHKIVSVVVATETRRAASFVDEMKAVASSSTTSNNRFPSSSSSPSAKTKVQRKGEECNFEAVGKGGINNSPRVSSRITTPARRSITSSPVNARQKSLEGKEEEEAFIAPSRNCNYTGSNEAYVATSKNCNSSNSEASIALSRNCNSSNGNNRLVPGTFGSTRLNSPSYSRQTTTVDAETAAHHRRERRLARISVSIVWLFVVCHVWKLVPTAYEAMHSDDGLNVQSWPFWLVIIEHISHTLITFNSAVNFLIYVLK